MLTAAEAAGTSIICSSFRTYDYQENLFENRIEQAEREASGRHRSRGGCRVLGGTSRCQRAPDRPRRRHHGRRLHGTGRGARKRQPPSSGSWLTAPSTASSCATPRTKSATTGIGYEPWHYRYVGKEAASAITQSGLCLEEWLVETYHIQA